MANAQMYHGSRYKLKVGDMLLPKTDYSATAKAAGRDLLYGTPDKQSARRFIYSHTHKPPSRVPWTRTRAWVYGMEGGPQWAPGVARDDLTEFVTSEPQKIISREKLKYSRSQVHLTKPELIAGTAALGVTAGGAYYYRHHNGRLQKVHKGRYPSKHMQRSMQP